MEKQALSPYFTSAILIALFMGTVTGVIFTEIVPGGLSTNLVVTVSGLVGNIFLTLLRMLVIPVVFVSLVNGIGGMPATNKLGTIGSLTIGLYICTTTVAVSMALAVTNFLHIGTGLEVVEATNALSVPTIPHLADVVTGFFPSNIISAMANGEIIQVLVFAALLGVAILRSGKAGQRFARMMQDLHEVLISLVLMVMQCAPIGVYAMTTNVVSEQGIGFIGSVAGYFCMVIVVLLLQVLVVYGSMLRLCTTTPLLTFLYQIRHAFTFAFSIASSLAAIPVVLEVAKERLKIGNETAAFVIPLGATLNMDGTAIMQGVATVFLSQVYGVHMTIEMYAMVVILAVFSSIGTAGIPGAGLLTLSMVLHEVGIPLDGIVMIIGVDRLLDMLRTGVNITGDLTVAMLVDKYAQSRIYKKAATTSL